MSRVSLLPSLAYDSPSSRRRISTASPPSSTPSWTATARNSHYRPFSTLYTDPPFIDNQEKSSSFLKRHSSIAGLQTFVHMGIGFKDKAKAKKIDAELIEIKMPSSPSPTQLQPLPHNVPQRPSTSSSSINSSPILHRVRKKRSMPSVPDPSTSVVSPSSHLHHQLSPPRSVDTPITSTISTSTKKRTRFLAQDHEPSENFIPKSIWAKRHNMKLHPYHQDVPYMQAYDPVLLDSDRYSDLLLQRLNYGYPSFHNYGKNPPAAVLDLGCGPGHWVLHAASVWKTSQITGLDLVDLTLPGFETTENADFVLGNFIGFDLPFPDNSFDYVRMANLVLCIPYEKWDFVLRQVHRVLTVDGRLELIDDQIFFPYGSTPKPPSSWSREMSDAFDDSYFDDKETMQGSGSDTGSTLDANSEPSNSSFEDQIVHPPTLCPYQPPMPTGSPCQSPGTTLDTESRYISWRNQATASRELESIFEIMLKQRYRIFPRPSDFILNRMECVFGRNAAGKTRSYHIKLAPVGSADAGSGQGDGEETKSNGGTAKKKPWMGLDREKASKKKEKKLKKINSSTSKVDTSTGSGSSGSSSERSSLENSISISSPVPVSTNVKAAGRLGLAFGSSLKETASTPPPTPQPDQAQVPLLSAKAAGRLGISYSDLAAATVASTHQRSDASPSPSPLQSPGLFVWPSTFIPLTPVELEMHANKYVHTLLGCKPALAEFIAQFADEDGTRLLDDDEFHDVIWKYECFRRSRFNWPSEIQDPYDDETAVDPPVFTPPPLKSKFGSKSNKNSLDLAYNGEELTHIRTIRVFEATKSDDWSFTSLFHHKTPPTS